MPLIKRRDKKVAYISATIAILFHLILYLIASWLGVIPPSLNIMDLVGIETDAPPPPPPPKPKVIKTTPTPPPKINPVINVKKIIIKPQLDTKFKLSIPDFETEPPEPDYTFIATQTDQALPTTDNFTLIDETQGMFEGLIDFGDGGQLGMKSNVYVKGRRTRGTFTWTVVRFASSYWESFIQSGGLKTLFNFINRNTQIKVNSDARTINLETPFDVWLKRAMVTISVQGKIEKSPVDKLLDELKRSVYELNKPEIDARDNYLDILWNAYDEYFDRIFEMKIKGRSIDEIMQDVKERDFVAWRAEGLKEVLTELEKFEHIKRYLNGKELKPLWMYAKRCEIMECPVIYLRGAPGITTIHEDLLSVLRTYINNGGLIWMDDTAMGTNGTQWLENRVFIKKLTGSVSLDEQTRQVFRRLSQNDKNVPGYELLGSEPNPGHPYTYIHFNIPEQSQVQLRIYNRIGYLVREYDLGELPSGAYVDLNNAPRWDCKDQKGNDVESGTYFVQMESGLFIKTKMIGVDNLRYLSNTHPLYSEVYTFDKPPVGYLAISYRPYGNATFGYYVGDHLAIVYNEGNSITDGMQGTKDAAKKEANSKWVTNVIVFALAQPTGINMIGKR